MQKNWLIKTSHPKLQVEISNALKIHPIVAQLLINRGMTTAKEAEDFLAADLSRLHDPFLLKDMDAAVGRIQKAKDKKETLLIFGDYDVDGITSSAILKNTLTALGIPAINYIPHRLNEGYGLNHGIVAFAKEKKVKLLVSVDCGIGAMAEIEALRENGIDTIVLDHHEPHEGRLPNAVAIVNQKQKDCVYPFDGLASVGLSFKLSQALTGERAQEYLDLVAMGTIADVAELNGENRVFVKEGLKRIMTTKNVGLKALMEVARIKSRKIRP